MAQFIIRVARRESIREDYLSNQITFSCSANWYDYAVKHKNDTVGDQLECVYAHLPIGDPRINEVDCHGNPMGNNLTMLFDERNQSVYLRHEPVLLTPAFCFYQCTIDRDSIIENNGLRFDLYEYCRGMGYKLEDVLFLVIHNPGEFEQDLRKNVPLAVKENAELLVLDGSGGYVQAFDDKNPINYCPVDYDKHNFDDFFYKKNTYKQEMWWKGSKYRTQSEGRVVVPSVHFRQRYSDAIEYDYSKNLLKVKLSNIKNYASIVDGSEYKYLDFYLDEDNNIKINGAYSDFETE